MTEFGSRNAECGFRKHRPEAFDCGLRIAEKKSQLLVICYWVKWYERYLNRFPGSRES
ncbi:hypothetical protein D1AOALGA4SA_7400 [Olavius algarvensis Delta 1 endosymbiont]|nr:hypothetical protein D1AOALGA4SA_7400 [Olavius algarvensis Delta 1 endosymbiont]